MVYKIQSPSDLKAKLAESGKKLVVVDFYATWCGPCKVIAPILEGIANEMKDTLAVFKVDVDEVEDLVGEYDIQVMPTFVFIKEGKKLETLRGSSESKLRDAINKHLA